MTLPRDICEHNLVIFLGLEKDQNITIDGNYRIDIDDRYLQLRRTPDRYIYRQPITDETILDVIRLTYQSLSNYPEFVQSRKIKIIHSLANLVIWGEKTLRSLLPLQDLVLKFKSEFENIAIQPQPQPQYNIPETTTNVSETGSLGSETKSISTTHDCVIDILPSPEPDEPYYSPDLVYRVPIPEMLIDEELVYQSPMATIISPVPVLPRKIYGYVEGHKALNWDNLEHTPTVKPPLYPIKSSVNPVTIQPKVTTSWQKLADKLMCWCPCLDSHVISQPYDNKVTV